MPFRYKVDLIFELKKAGYSTYKIRKDKILSERTLSKFRHGEVCSIETLDLVCDLLKMQPGDIIEHVHEE